MYDFQRLIKTKTFWTALAGACTAIGLFVGSEIGLPELLMSLFAAAQTINWRDTKVKEEASASA